YPGGQCGNGTVGTECYPSATFYAVSGGFTYGTAAPAGTALSNTTGKLTVIGIDSIRVVDAPGGTGSWVSSRDYLFADTDTFWAAAYAATTGCLGDLTSSWSSLNPGVGSITPTGVNGTGYRSYFSALSLGFTYVTATPVGTTLVNSTGRLTVTGISIDYVQIRNAPNGLGTVVGPRTYFEREQDTYYAATYNFTRGYRGDAPSDWGSNSSAVCEVHGWNGNAHGSSAQILLKSPGTCTITVRATTVSGPKTNTTGTLTVEVRTLVTVDDSGGADFLKIQD